MNLYIIAKANPVIRACCAAYLGVIDENGRSRVSTASTIKQEGVVITLPGFIDTVHGLYPQSGIELWNSR